MTVDRDRWQAFRDRVDRMAVLDDATLGELLAGDPASWFVRSCVVYVARQDRELASDAQLEQLARAFGGKIATFIDGILIARRVRRDPMDPAARRDAEAFGQAWLRARLLT
jgi:hypothetical protein